MNDTPITDEFFEAFDDDTGYQSDTETQVEDPVQDEPAAEPQAEEVTAEESEEGKETPAKEEPGAEPGQDPEAFTLKVNKEERTVTREEMIAYAQKGVDYDRVKAAEQAKSDNTALREQNAKMQEAYDLLEQIAGDSKSTVAELLETMRVNRLVSQGLSEETAKERIAREKAEKALADASTKQEVRKETAADRAAREVADFRKEYPNVDMSKELMDRLVEDVQNGMSLTQAYQKYESAQKDARIQQLQAELEAEKKNRENRSTSPGSQSDSGAKRVTDKFDDFFDAFN